MTQEEVELLFRDLCARLPYGVKITFAGYSGRDDCILNSQHLNSTYAIEYLGLKPYLRPLSNMTEKEKKELNNVLEYQYYADDSCMCEASDWLNAHHFDHRRLIEKGLAIAVTEENNPYEN